MREMDHDIAPTGEGNVCSLEFNLLYRWHASLSQKDEVWIGNMFTHIFRKPFEEVGFFRPFTYCRHLIHIKDHGFRLQGQYQAYAGAR